MALRTTAGFLLAAALAFALLGCSGGRGHEDGGIDAGVDAGADAGTDAGADAGTDAGVDAGTDAGVDAGTDAGTPADTEILTGPEGLVATSTASFTFESIPPGAAFECSLDGSPYYACTSPENLTDVVDGTHAFAVRAVTAAGGDPTPATRTWTNDTRAPGVTIASGPEGVGGTLAVFGFTVDETASLRCTFDGGALDPCASPIVFGSLMEGVHSILIEATDAAGNVGSASRTWYVDAQPPTVTILSGPEALTSSRTAAFVFAIDEPATARCGLGGSLSPCESPYTVTDLADGPHVFTIQAVDAVGNLSALVTWEWSVDATAPTVTITSGPSGAVASAAASFEFTADEPGAFVCAFDAEAPAPCTSPASTSGLSEGSHTFTVSVTDTAGNVGSTSRSWTVDTQAPGVTITSGPAAAVSSTSATFNFTVDEPATRTCALDTQAPVTCSSPYVLTGLGEGTHALVVSARDAAGNSGSATWTWTVDTRAPVVTIDSGPEGWGPDLTATFAFSTNEPANATCALDGQAATACVSPAVESGLSDGVHTLVIRATDAAGNAGTASASWGVDSAYSTAAYIRIAASNLSSGNYELYEAYGTRILQGLMPDIVLLQEFRPTRTNTDTEVQSWVTNTFGLGFNYYREASGTSMYIPNGIISRYPILASGRWADPIPTITDRGIVWSRIDIPGPLDLWAVSLHLYAGGTTTDRNNEALSVVADVQSLGIPPADLLVMGGDLNTGSRVESCLTTLGQLVWTSSPYPVDQAGNAMTNANRTKPYDWVMADPELKLLQVPVLVGRQAFPNGLVFDSRVYTPLSDAPGVLQTDSGAANMQHMLVIKDFRVSLP